MSSISLMDIILIENYLGYKILTDNTPYITKCINETCLVFNKISKEDIDKHRKEYYIIYIPKKIEEIIEDYSVYYIINNSIIDNSNKDYLEKYQIIKKEYIDKINNSIYYDNILHKIIKLFKKYVINSYNNIWTEWTDYWGKFFNYMMIEIYIFIKDGINYKLTKKDFEGEENIITMLDNLFSIEILS